MHIPLQYTILNLQFHMFFHCTPYKLIHLFFLFYINQQLIKMPKVYCLNIFYFKMNSRTLFSLTFALILVLLSSSKLLHLETNSTQGYEEALLNTQSNIENQLSTLISKLRFINDTLAQAYPNETISFPLTVPAILN